MSQNPDQGYGYPHAMSRGRIPRCCFPAHISGSTRAAKSGTNPKLLLPTHSSMSRHRRSALQQIVFGQNWGRVPSRTTRADFTYHSFLSAFGAGMLIAQPFMYLDWNTSELQQLSLKGPCVVAGESRRCLLIGRGLPQNFVWHSFFQGSPNIIAVAKHHKQTR